MEKPEDVLPEEAKAEEALPEEAKAEEAVAPEEKEVVEEVLEEVEEKPPPRREEKEEEFVEERIYTIPLRRAWIAPPKKRAPRAIRIIKAFVEKHMKVGGLTPEEEEEEEGGKVILSNEVNEKVWSRGIEKPPRKLRVRLGRDEEGNVTVLLA